MPPTGQPCQEPSCEQGQTISEADKEGLFPTHAGGHVLAAVLLLLPPVPGLQSRADALFSWQRRGEGVGQWPSREALLDHRSAPMRPLLTSH